MIEASPIRSGKIPSRARYLLWLLLPAAFAAHAQETLSAEDAVRLALARPEIERGLTAGIDIARSDVIDARTWANPELQIERERSEDGTAAAGGNATETSIVLSQQIDLSGRRGLRRRAAELGVSAAEAEAAFERARLRAEVLRRYYAVAVAEQRLQAYAQWSDGLDELTRIAQQRSEAGDLAGYDSRRIAQSQAQAQARHAEARAERGIARERLAAYVGEVARDAALAADISVLPAAVPPLPDETIPNAALAALDRRRAQAEADVRTAARWSLPVTVGIGRKRFETPGVSDEALLLELSVPLPLFDRNQAGALRARAEAQQAQSRYQLALSDIRTRRRAAWQEATRLSEAARLLRNQTVPQARELTQVARLSFAEGELGLVGLLDSFDAQVEVVDQSLDLQYRAQLAAIELEQLLPSEASAPTTHQETLP